MTTRDDARRAVADLRAGSRAAGSRPGQQKAAEDAGPNLPERLASARERKGVDLYRAERDTKIRARYLAALERGEYRELPGAVYTKGFLRNYALYLGLDPEDVLRQWKRERGDSAIPAEPALAVPRPLQAPRQGLTFSPGVIVAALMTVSIVLFVGYLGVQLLRFAKPPTLAVTDPAQAVLDVSEDSSTYVLKGTSIPGATITIEVPGQDQPYRVSADGSGRWTAEVELRRGRNQFDITALDPDTGKIAETPARVFITVPFLQTVTPTLQVDSPADGTRFENGAIPVQGIAKSATSVKVSAVWLGPADGQPVASAAPSPPAVAPVSVEVAGDGTFQTPFELTAGRWSLTITASAGGSKTVTLLRTVSVEYQGVNLAVQVKGGSAWLKVWVDGKLDPSIGAAGKTIRNGRTLTFTGATSIEVRTGSSGATSFTLNGTNLGALGRRGIPETWLFEPPNEPVQTERR